MNKKLLKMTETAILVAMAVIIEMLFRLTPSMPNGGGISLGMLPVIILAYRNGSVFGFIGGFLFAIYNFLIDPYAFHWGSFFFDYLFPFTFIGFAGFFTKALRGSKKQFVLGIALVFIIRYFCHSFGGVLFFVESAKDTNAWYYSFIFYNLPYCAGSWFLCTIVGMIIYKTLLKITNKDF